MGTNATAYIFITALYPYWSFSYCHSQGGKGKWNDSSSSSSSVALKDSLLQSVPVFVTPKRKLIVFGIPRLTENTFRLEFGKLIVQDFRTDFSTILLPCKVTLLNLDILFSCGQKRVPSDSEVQQYWLGSPFSNGGSTGLTVYPPPSIYNLDFFFFFFFQLVMGFPILLI